MKDEYDFTGAKPNPFAHNKALTDALEDVVRLKLAASIFWNGVRVSTPQGVNVFVTDEQWEEFCKLIGEEP